MKENKNILENKIEADTKSVGVQLPVIPPKNSFILGDCMDYLPLFPPNFFDLAIVDPPYGIGEGKRFRGMGSSCMATDYGKKDWDNSPPPKEYFDELFRVSKNQVIWGGNYLTKHLPPKMGWIFWDKEASGDFSDGELAYTSFNKALKKITFAWMGMRQGDMKEKEKRIHPTQKPVKLYKWILKNYAAAGDLILDTHVGSASSLIACTELGFDYIGFEKDEEYYTMAKSRLGRATRKYELFEAV